RNAGYPFTIPPAILPVANSSISVGANGSIHIPAEYCEWAHKTGDMTQWKHRMDKIMAAMFFACMNLNTDQMRVILNKCFPPKLLDNDDLKGKAITFLAACQKNNM